MAYDILITLKRGMILTVYVDVLLIVNLYINYILLLCTSKIIPSKPEQVRILISSVIGSIYGLIIFLPDLPKIVELLSKIIVSVIMIIICFGFINTRQFIRGIMSFLAVSFTFAGLMYLIWTAVAPINMYLANGIAYFDIDLKVLVITTIACFIIICAINFFISRKAPKSSIYQLTVTNSGKSAELTGLCDTGNSLREAFSGYPVFISQYDAIKEILPQSVRNYFNSTEPKADGSIRFVVYNTISGSGLLPTFRPDEVRIKSLSRNFTVNDVYIAVIDKNLGNGEYQIILNPSVFEEAKL